MSNSYTTHNLDISESKRCIGCANPRCKNACPLGNDVPAFLKYVSIGEYNKAVELIGHPFGEICGYVCPHELHCQGGCVLGKTGQAVQMGAVERAVFQQYPYKVERKGNVANELKVAVVGGGVSGITFAVKMYEQGADVTLYEKDELLSTLKLIPNFRLPCESIARIEKELNGKFTIVKKAVTSKDFTILQRDFDIVYLATGASVLYGLGMVGEELAIPYDKFLRSASHCSDVVVIGGGNTAMDCARLAKRSGGKVTIAYRRQREDMPAFNNEVDDAYSEQVQFVYNVAPVKLESHGDKLLLTLAKTASEGRGKLTVTDETTTILCDTVVSALGSKFDASIYGELQIGDDAKHPLSNVYVGGDAVGGKIVAKAVADAMQSARLVLENLLKK